MAEILNRWLDEQTRTPAQKFWGERDCLLFVCNWIQFKRGIDPAEPYRGTYATELECLRILKRDGGVAGIMRARCEACGFPPTSRPKDGDIALLSAPISRRGKMVMGHVGGIVIGHKCAIAHPHGLDFTDALRLEAWEV